jgi:phage terminase small subunit
MADTTHRRELFAREYIKHLNGAQAARDIGISPASARSEACRMLAEPEVEARIAELIAERSRRVEIDADTVLREIHAIATADANELIEYRRVCCRHCHGLDFHYQRTAREMTRDRELFDKSDLSLVDHFDELGGDGFNSTNAPNADCPHCHGEGHGEVHVKDTRFLSPAARALYAGVKRTKDGIEVKLHDKVKNLELLARHLGLLNDKLEVSGELNLAARIVEARKRTNG